MSRPRLLITRRWPEEVERHLAQRYEVMVNETDTPLSIDALAAALRSVDALCPTVSDPISAEVLEGARARLIANYGVGFSHIDIEACERLGIAVTNTPDVLTEATADIAMMLMLMAARRAGEGERHLRARAWTGWRPSHMVGVQVTGKTLGLVGFGRIAQATARKAHHGFGMRILYHSRRAAARDIEAGLGARFCPTLDELLPQADFVSIHTPGGPSTRHLIDAERLIRMKPTAYLINTARGEVVDEMALIAALQSRAIAGAGLDVYESEPQVPAALMALENVVLLPHLGSATSETRIAMGMRVAENIDAFFAGKPPPDRIF